MVPFLYIFFDWGILVLRIALGVIFIAHGFPKIKNLRQTAEMFAAMGFRPGKFWGTLVALLEFFGGLALIAGLFTQFFAALFALQFIVVILKLKGKQGMVGGFEFDLLIFAAAALLVFSGAGAISADNALGWILRL